jgi:hypothetical protein
MKHYKIIQLRIIVFSYLFGLSILFAQQNYNLSFTTISCVLHIHSNFSSGKNSIEEIVDLAKQHNIGCVVLTDHFLRKVEYGLWPFRGIIKKSVSLPSVMKFGVDKYLSKIEEINKKQKDVIVIPGLEITPHYFWSVEEDCLVINNLHKHMLIIGLDKKNLFYSLPAIGNEANAGKIKILSFLPIVFLLLGIFFKSKFLIIFSLIFLSINYPFKYLPFDQYKNYSELPYQNLINYINSIPQYYKTNSITPLIIWAHPEAPNYEKKYLLKTIRKLKIFTQTIPYGESLLKTYDYDGFSIFAEGYRDVGGVCKIWDNILTEYCKGIRKRPVWCYSEVDFGESSDPLYVRKNILYVKDKNYRSIIEALKNGNFYALWRNEDKELLLKNFKVCSQSVMFGEKYKLNSSDVVLEFEVEFSDNNSSEVEIFIISNNAVVYRQKTFTPAKIIFKDLNPNKLSYYRIYIESKYPHKIATNPIFIE